MPANNNMSIFDEIFVTHTHSHFAAEILDKN